MTCPIPTVGPCHACGVTVVDTGDVIHEIRQWWWVSPSMRFFVDFGPPHTCPELPAAQG